MKKLYDRRMGQEIGWQSELRCDYQLSLDNCPHVRIDCIQEIMNLPASSVLGY